MNKTTQRVVASVAGLATLAGLVACGGADEPVTDGSAAVDAAPSTSAVDGPVETLRIGVVPGWEARVEALRLDPVEVEIDFEWQDAHAGPDIEQDIIAAVASGELDLGFVGARVFAGRDVHELDALTAPYLVDSYALQQAIVDSDLPARMLPALEALGIVGLALVPGPMRFPLGVDGALTGPDDFAGIVFHTWRAETNAATVRALGASHTDVYGEERDQQLLDGSIDATENGLEWAVSNGRAGHVAVNAPLWPATAVLIGNPDRLAGLPDGGPSIGAELEVSPGELAADDTRLALGLCKAGREVVNASDEDLTALRAAVEPVYRQLREDDLTAGFLDEIQALAETVDAEQPAMLDGCTGKKDDTTAVGSDDPAVLNGSFRLEWTAEELVERDVPERDARANAGGYVLTFRDGTFDQVWEKDPGGSCPGTYGVTGNRLKMVAADDLSVWDCGGDSLGAVLVDAEWRIERNRLVLSDFRRSDEPDVTWWSAIFLAKPLTKVG